MLTGRAIALLAACALSLQALGAPMPMASCCCEKKSVECHCPVCTHGREIESGCRFLQSCAPASKPAITVAPLPALPVVFSGAVVEIAPLPLPEGPPRSGAPEPTVDVPTPPPLQA